MTSVYWTDINTNGDISYGSLSGTRIVNISPNGRYQQTWRIQGDQSTLSAGQAVELYYGGNNYYDSFTYIGYVGGKFPALQHSSGVIAIIGIQYTGSYTLNPDSIGPGTTPVDAEGASNTVSKSAQSLNQN